MILQNPLHTNLIYLVDCDLSYQVFDMEERAAKRSYETLSSGSAIYFSHDHFWANGQLTA